MSAFEIPLSDPDLTQLELDAVIDLLKSTRISSGPVVEAFEATFKADISRLDADIKKLNERMFALEKKDVEQDERLGNVETVVTDHENRINNLEEGIFSGYFGAKFLTS
ncbi:MAG TPA: hypothetical protein PKO17_08945, partial [Pseudomonadales bacterium]|nr:hypothetical protein [Pseudomonadales bacterium]